MKSKFAIGLLALVLIATVAATGCSTSGVTNEQYMTLQSQVNTLNSSLTSTQQQLSTTQQQLSAAQQSLSQAQSQAQQPQTFVTSAQPEPVYQPTVIYQTYPYMYRYYPSVTPWHQSPLPPRPPRPNPPTPPPYPPLPH